VWKETQMTVARSPRKSIIFWPILPCRITLVLHRIYMNGCASRTIDLEPSPAFRYIHKTPSMVHGI